jgi:hypothetical protein
MDKAFKYRVEKGLKTYISHMGELNFRIYSTYRQ